MDLLFFFDSEDYETPASDEGELWWAEALSRHGLTGCFNLVGEEARALRDRGRRDVLAALARHEIGYHSNLHSAHPVHLEYLEGMGWDEGVAAVLSREARGVADVRELTGQHPATYCKPGSNWAPQVLAAMNLLDIPVFCDAPFEWGPGLPLWYCGNLCVGYHTSFDQYFSAANRREQMRRDIRALIDERRENGGVLVMYTHPCRLITAAFPSNFTAGQNPPRSAWTPAPSRPRAEVEELMTDFDDFLGWIARQSDVQVISYRTLYERHRRGNVWLDGEGVVQLLTVDTVGLEPRRIGGMWLSPAEQLGALIWIAAWRREHGTLPSTAPVRPLLGPDVLAPSVEPYDVDAAAVFASAGEINLRASERGRIPSPILLDGRLIGPATFFGALLQALRDPSGRVSVDPCDEIPSLARRSDFARLHFGNTWSILPPEFEAPGIIQLAHLQAWSARPVN